MVAITMRKAIDLQAIIAKAIAGHSPDEVQTVLCYVLAGLGLAAGFDKKEYAGSVLADLDSSWRWQKAKALCPGKI